MSAEVTPFWSSICIEVLYGVAMAHHDNLEEQSSSMTVHRSAQRLKSLTLLHVCRSWRHSMLTHAKLWFDLPPQVSALTFQAFLQHAARNPINANGASPPTLEISSISVENMLGPLQFACTILPRSSSHALCMHLDARTLLGGILIEASPYMTHLSLKDVGTANALTIVTQLAPHLQSVTLETSRRTDLKIAARHVNAVTPLSFPHLKALDIASDCASSLQALTNLLRLSHHARMHIRWRNVRTIGTAENFLQCLLADRKDALPTLFLDVESRDYTRLLSCSDPAIPCNAEDVPTSNPEFLEPLLDVTFEWANKLTTMERSRYNGAICSKVSAVSPSIKHVVLVYGHRGEDAIDLCHALVTLADLADGLQTLVLRGDWKLAMEALQLTLLPDLYRVVVQDHIALAQSADMVDAVRVLHPVINDTLRSMALGARVYVGSECIFAHRSSARLWDIQVPEEMWLEWNESTIIDFYDPVSEETQTALNYAYDEWMDEIYLPGKGGHEVFEWVEQVLIDKVQREQDAQEASEAAKMGTICA
ncbi:unnamed protein product [Peniophora sp. CBMAI 1063]|nr:unnamed protein product [Peniophora sp. CBMAI 1063]